MRSAICLLSVLFILVLLRAYAAEVLTLDDFEYADEQAARASWKPAENSDPIGLMPCDRGGGKTALKMPCPFARQDIRRSVYDRDISVDLTRYGTICFDLYVDDRGPVSNFTIYFRSGEGWYSGHADASRKGWQQVRLPKAGFGTEGNPAGWAHIDGIRLSAWKATPRDTFCAVDNLRAETDTVVVVFGSNTKGSEARGARTTAQAVYELLQEAGVAVGLIDEGDVERGALAGQKLAIFAYSPEPSDQELTEVEAFVGRGGKIIVFYSLHPRLAALLGVRSAGWKRADRAGEFQEIVFEAPEILGLPPTILQNSWNTVIPEPAGQNARPIGHWRDAEGKLGPPAVLISDTGAYMGHILTGADMENKKLFLLSLVGHFVPEAWEEASARALESTLRIGSFDNRDALERFLAEAAPRVGRQTEVQAKLAEARQAEDQVKRLQAGRKYPDVLRTAAVLRRALVEAYAFCHAPRDGEFRAVWNHSGTGDCGTWDEAMRRLAAANFNAVVPNMWWAGLAHYDSKLLPHSRIFEENGDQIAQAVEAGKKYGIEVHPWKVNWNLSTAPEEFRQRMRAEGRTQKTWKGEDVDWLCPSHPDNFKLELDTMLEVALNYDVQGIHFDYIRYPDGDTCYCDGCRRRFEESRGAKVENWPTDCYNGPLRNEYREWRCEQINRLVRATAEELRRVKPHVKISAAVFSSYPACRDSVGQDWVRWAKEGWVDFLCPMDYTNSDDRFEQLVSTQVGLVAGRVPVYPGIGFSSSSSSLSPDRVIGQIEIARQQGADGFIIFNMGEDLTLTVFPELAKAITSQKAVLPHNAPQVRFTFPVTSDEPVLALNDRSVSVQVTLESLGRHSSSPNSATGVIELQDVYGKKLAQLGPLPSLAASTTVTVQHREGVLRLAAVGEMTFQGGTKQRFIVRSRPFAFSGD